MWCDRRVCLNKTDFAASRKKNSGDENTSGKRDCDESSGKVPFSKDFRIALTTLTTEEDYKALEEQFFSSKE